MQPDRSANLSSNTGSFIITIRGPKGLSSKSKDTMPFGRAASPPKRGSSGNNRFRGRFTNDKAGEFKKSKRSPDSKSMGICQAGALYHRK